MGKIETKYWYTDILLKLVNWFITKNCSSGEQCFPLASCIKLLRVGFTLFIFLCPKMGCVLFLSCLSFCDSVNLSEFLTFLITFEQWKLELWYFTWVFLCYKNSPSVPTFFNLWTWPWSLAYFFNTLTLITFDMLELFYITWIFLVYLQKFSVGI